MSTLGRESLVAADDTWSLMVILCAGVALSIWLEQKYNWASKISGAIIALIIAMVLANVGIIPISCPLYDDVVWGIVVPMNVREKLSLCYYASSLFHWQKGIITVSSGIEFQNFQRAYDEIQSQMKAVQDGKLDEWELAGARSTLCNAYATIGDSQSKLENFWLGRAATGRDDTPEELAEGIRTVSSERIYEAMRTVSLDTVYFLKGEGAEE